MWGAAVIKLRRLRVRGWKARQRHEPYLRFHHCKEPGILLEPLADQPAQHPAHMVSNLRHQELGWLL